MNPQEREQARNPESRAGASRNMRELIETLERQAALANELADVLAAQRGAVAANDVMGLESSIVAVHRVILTLAETHRRRKTLEEALGVDSTKPLDPLEPVVGTPPPPALAEARARLRRAAQQTAREAAINDTVLRRAVEAGETFLQELFSSVADPDPVYHAPDRKTDATPSAGMLLNRRV